MSVSGIVRAEEEGGIAYTVSFVNAEDHNIKIFNTQQGAVPEGTVLRVSFPEQIIGSDGHIWSSLKQSPLEVWVYQEGIHKYYIEYRQGERVKKPEEPDRAQRKLLEQWLQKAREADHAITGQEAAEIREADLIVTDITSNNRRIWNLVSAVQDAGWHYFYLIGRNYTPETVRLGTDFEAVYSTVSEDSFSLDGSSYEVYRVGVKRNWNPQACTHSWDRVTYAVNGCLEYGEETWQCGRCGKMETSLLPSLGHTDENGDSVCDRCLNRVFAQETGSRIFTVMNTKTGEIPLSFTCIDGNYKGTGDMLYLLDEVLDGESAGLAKGLSDGEDYDNSPVRQYLNLSFSNSISLAGILRVIHGASEDGMGDLAVLLSEEEFEAYRLLGRVSAVDRPWALRTAAEDLNGMRTVASDGRVEDASPDQMAASGCGIRPAILLKAPDLHGVAEKRSWKEGDTQMRQIGNEVYRFRCVDEDYSDARDGHRKSALFLCDRVIRADIDRGGDFLKAMNFGNDNNYKTSGIRRWLNENSKDAAFGMESAYIGVNTAYMGESTGGSFGQLSDSSFVRREIGFQLMQDHLFCLSLEEALKYRDVLWSFGGQENGGGTDGSPQSQISAYSAGYYLRTPFYTEDEAGNFRYSNRIYAVDLVKGNIHPVNTDSETFGMRPAFTLLQE